LSGSLAGIAPLRRQATDRAKGGAGARPGKTRSLSRLSVSGSGRCASCAGGFTNAPAD